MRNPFKRQPNVYSHERQRLLEHLGTLTPSSDEYETVMMRLNELDRILNRTSELKKTVIPVLGTIGGVAGVYGLQQFAGVLVPKALDSLAARQEQKKPQPQELD